MPSASAREIVRPADDVPQRLARATLELRIDSLEHHAARASAGGEKHRVVDRRLDRAHAGRAAQAAPSARGSREFLRGLIGFRLTCAVTLSRRSRIACRKPVFIESAITSVVTPAATPITASSVTSRSTAGRFGERRYRSATSHSNVIWFSPAPVRRRRCRRTAPRASAASARKQREQNHFPDRMRIGEQHHQPVDADSFAGRGRQAVAQRANVIHVHFLRRFLPAFFHLRAKTPLLIGGIVQLGESVGDFHARDEQLEPLGERGIVLRGISKAAKFPSGNRK